MFHSSFLRPLVFAVLCVLLLTMSLPLTMAPRTASAQGNSVTLNPASGNPGTPVTATGDGWPANDPQIQIWFDQTNTGKSTSADANGHFSVNFNVPPNATQGLHPVSATDGRESASALFNVTQQTTPTVIVQKVFTADSNNNAKTAFAPGDLIHYMWEAQNTSSTPVTATVTYRATGPQQIYYWSGSASLASGPLRYYSAPTIPTNALAGTYTITVTITYNGVSSSGQSQFTVSDKVANAIAWAKSQLGSQNWNGLCEKFVENAYGTNGQYLTAQDAYKVLHTSTNWSPDIGALVWFVPNASNGNVGHVGIYIGQGQFISATYNGVQINSMKSWSTNVASYEGWGDAPSSWPGR